MGVEIATISESQLIENILGALDRRDGGWVVTANLDIIRQAVQDSDIAAMIGRSTISVADGMPLVWASKIIGQPLPGRIAGSTLIFTLTEAAAKAGRSIYLLGGNEGVAEEAKQRLVERYPGLEIVGHFCPPMGFDQDDEQVEAIANRLREADPDIVYVALGFPKQERLIERVRSSCPEAWWLGLGISFSFVAGRVKRAPRWIQRLGFEWAHRMSQEPRRLFKRYAMHGFAFLLRLMIWVLCRRISR